MKDQTYLIMMTFSFHQHPYGPYPYEFSFMDQSAQGSNLITYILEKVLNSLYILK